MSGIFRHTLIDGDKIEQLYYAENAEGKFGALVWKRVVTRKGVTTEEIFDPPIPEHGQGIVGAASHAQASGQRRRGPCSRRCPINST